MQTFLIRLFKPSGGIGDAFDIKIGLIEFFKFGDLGLFDLSEVKEVADKLGIVRVKFRGGACIR